MKKLLLKTVVAVVILSISITSCSKEKLNNTIQKETLPPSTIIIDTPYKENPVIIIDTPYVAPPVTIIDTPYVVPPVTIIDTPYVHGNG